ncbi:PKD-like domain-containing protein, partial [Fulvivirga sp.]|uniref:PKD-like domain-containing protein n=1 Tax=Fulvivirga sp. TaxID=1931237 RepID=UPI0032EB5157
MKIYLRLTLFLVFLGFANVGFGQLNATQARHESLLQNQVAVTLDGNLGVLYSNTAGWALTVGGSPATISSVIGAPGSNVVTISFTPAIGIGESVVVNFAGDAAINNIVNLNSQNNWIQVCDDFSWVGNNVATDVCAPVSPQTRMTFVVTARLRNSSNWNVGAIGSRVFWGDAGNTFTEIGTYESDAGGNPAANQFFVTVDHSLTGYSYPANENVCGYSSATRLRLYNAPAILCAIADANQNVVYSSYNTDGAGEGDGALASQPTVAFTDQVCEGDFVNMSFDDISDLNCIDLAAAPAPFTLNSRDRNIRVIYGFPHVPGNTIRNVEVLGTQITDASGNLLIPGGFIPTIPNALGTPDAFGVVNFPAPVAGPAGTLETITTSTPTLIGDAGRTFNITIQYWNFCNTYDGLGDAVGMNAREITDEIIVVTSPDAPTVNNPVECESAGNGSFTITANGVAGANYTWYADAALTQVLQGPNNDNTFNPVTQGPAGFRINKNVATSTIFTRYVTQTDPGGINCTSPPAEITIQIDALNTAGTISHPSGATPISICTGDNPPAFTSTTPGSGGGPGGIFTYQWQSSTTSAVAGFAAASGINDQPTYDPPALATTTWYRRRVRSGQCADVFSNVIEFSVDQPVTAGAIGNPQTLCTGSDPAALTSIAPASGGNGIFTYLWQQSNSFGGPYAAASGTNDQVTYNPPVLTNTTFYRRLVFSGVCAPGSAVSNVVEVTMDQIVDPGVVNNPQNICAGDDPSILGETTPPSGGDGVTYNITWQESTTGGGVGFVAAAGVNNLSTYDPPVLTSTMYYRRQVISGVCPTTFSNEIEILVDPLPTATVSGGGSVCAGTAAPNIVWTFTGTPNYDFVLRTITDPGGANIIVDTPISGHTTNIFTIVSPNPAQDTDYEIISLVDDNVCSATSLGGVASVTISPTLPPSIEFFVPGSPVCDDDLATVAPTLTVDLAPDLIQDYEITYNINGGSDQILSTTTDASGEFTINPDYVTQLGTTPGTYTFEITSIVNITTNCNATGLPDARDIIINPRPADPTGPIGATACSSDPTGATISVDDPGAGFVVRWYTAYTDELTNTPAIGVTGGSNEETFTPNSNATQTYITVIESNTAPTNCHSVNTLDVEHIQDLLPTAADADLDNDVTLLETCTDELLLGAIAADNGGTGTWTFPGLLFYEDFNGFSDGTYQSLGTFGWSRDISATAFDGPTDHFEVRSNAFEANDLNGEGIWNSEPIDISAIANFDISIDAIEVGDHEGTDYIQLWYQIDANAEQMVGQVTGNFGTSPISGTIPTGGGTNVVIRVKVLNNANAEFLSFDNVSLTDAAGTILTFDDIHDENATVSGLPVGITTLTWSVSSALGSCAPSTQTVDVQRNPLPTANDITPELCDETFGNPLEVTGVDLTIALYSDAITGIVGSANRSIAYFDDASRNIATDLILDPTDVDISDGEVVYITVTDTDPSLNTTCTSDSEITFTVYPLPAVTEPTIASRTFCEDVQGSGSHAGVDLDAYNAQISGTTTITWFPTLADAQAGSNQIAAGAAVGQVGNFTAFGGSSVFARAEDANACANFQEVAFVTSPLPAANSINGSTIQCTSPSQVRIYQLDPATNVFGTTHVYNWEIDGNGTNFEVFDGTTFTVTDSYTVTQASFLLLLRFPNAGTFDIVASETIDGCLGPDATTTVNVTGAPPPLVFDAPETQVCKGETGVTYSLVGGAQVGSNYVWEVQGGSIVGPSSGNFASITVNWGTSTAPPPFVRVTESNSNLCAGAPVSVNVFLNDVPVMTSANSTTICSGDSPSSNINFTATVGGVAPVNPITFNWRVTNVAANVSGVVLNQTGVGNLTDQITNVSGSSGIVQYIVTPTENELPVSPACEGVGQTITVTVEPQPVIVPLQVKTICSGDNVDYHVNLTPAGLPLNTEYTWGLPTMSAGPAQGSIGTDVPESNALTITDVLTNTTGASITATYSVTPTVDGGLNCTTLPAVDVVITVNPEPVIIPAQTKEICSGENVNYEILLSPLNLPAGTVFSWADPDGIGPATSQAGIAMGAAGTLHITDVLTNTTGAPFDVTYVVTATSGVACDGTIENVVITVNPEPVGINTTETICSGTSFSINPQTNNIDAGAGNGVPSSFTWSAVYGAVTGGVAPAPIPNGGLLSETLTNVTGASIDVVYTIFPTSDPEGCAGVPAQSFTHTVTVDPEPVGINTTETICSGTSFSINPQTNNIDAVGGNGVPSSFTWSAVYGAVTGGVAPAPIPNGSSLS